MLKLARHVKVGDDLKGRLERARTRDDVAKYVRALRRWHHTLLPLAEDHSPVLAEGLRKLYPRPEETVRVRGVRLIGRHSHRQMLNVVSAALYRLAPLLTTVPRGKPGRKPGQGKYKDEKALAEIARLVNEEGFKPWPAAQKAVELADPQGTQDTFQRTKRIYDKYRKLHRINSMN